MQAAEPGCLKDKAIQIALSYSILVEQAGFVELYARTDVNNNVEATLACDIFFPEGVIRGPLGKRVESRCGAVILQVRHICCRLFRLAVPYCPDHKSRFHTPLIEPDVRF